MYLGVSTAQHNPFFSRHISSNFSAIRRACSFMSLYIDNSFESTLVVFAGRRLMKKLGRHSVRCSIASGFLAGGITEGSAARLATQAYFFFPFGHPQAIEQAMQEYFFGMMFGWHHSPKI